MHEMALATGKTCRSVPARVILGLTDDQPSWLLERHDEALRIACGVPLSAGMTAVESWRVANPQWAPLVVEIEQADMLTAAALIGYRARLGLTQALRLGSQDEVGAVCARSAPDVERLASGVKKALDGLGRPWVLRLAHLPVRETATQQFIAAFEHVALRGECNAVRPAIGRGFAAIVRDDAEHAQRRGEGAQSHRSRRPTVHPHMAHDR